MISTLYVVESLEPSLKSESDHALKIEIED